MESQELIRIRVVANERCEGAEKKCSENSAERIE